METEDSVKQNYEVAFHINPNVEEPKVAQIKTTLEELILAKGGTITFSKVPERTRLSYAIKHQRASFFGYIHFSLADKDGLLALDESLRLNFEILRYIILKLETDAQKQKAITRAAQQKERMERRAKQMQQQPVAEKKDSKEMEKQLEDVIGNLK